MSEEKLPRFMVRVDTLPKNGFSVSLESTNAEREAIARHAEVLSVEQLHCTLKLSRWRSDGVRVEGDLMARVTQACVITLDPVEQRIDEPIAMTFLPEGSGLTTPRSGEAAELLLDPEGEDPPEIFSGNAIDVWSVALEALVLAIDPFPRAAGAELPENDQEDELVAEKSPFAALEQLKAVKK